ncbi:MAG: PilZ domain-containing protein [Thermodesulfovibrionia bacterium]|nr:PilZ domain-containing protein [Thermodesulfovibrionia bacterium]
MIYNDMVLNFWRKNSTEKRTYERIQTHLFVRLLNGDSPYNALLTNLSENGIYFISETYLSFGLNIEVSIPYKEDLLKVPFKIIRTVKTGCLYDGFGAELSEPLKDYLEFADSLKASL